MVKAPKPAPRSPKRETYKSRIIALVSRPEGATAEELLAMTNWQPHTLRGFFSHQCSRGA